MEGLTMDLKAGTYPEGIKCRHKNKPAEPFIKEGQHGLILRVTPARREIPAAAYVKWDEDLFTWERLADLH